MAYVILLLVVIFAALYYFRNKLVAVMSFVITVTMVISGIAVLVGLFVPSVFTSWAEYTLENAGTLSSIQKIDGSVSLDTVTETANSVWEQLRGIFGVTPNPTDTPVPPAKNAGILEKNLYPGLVSGLAQTYRTLTIGIGLAVMGISVYLAYATGGVAETASLTKRIEELEEKVRSLEGE